MNFKKDGDNRWLTEFDGKSVLVRLTDTGWTITVDGKYVTTVDTKQKAFNLAYVLPKANWNYAAAIRMMVGEG